MPSISFFIVSDRIQKNQNGNQKSDPIQQYHSYIQSQNRKRRPFHNIEDPHLQILPFPALGSCIMRNPVPHHRIINRSSCQQQHSCHVTEKHPHKAGCRQKENKKFEQIENSLYSLIVPPTSASALSLGRYTPPFS